MQRCKQVLIVEDDEGVRESLRLALEVEGYSVTVCENGEEGLRLLPELSTPCLILLDLMMPIMDGWAFAEALRRDVTLASIPVVVVSAFAEQADGIKQARRVLKKPVDLEGLLRTVREFCA